MREVTVEGFSNFPWLKDCRAHAWSKHFQRVARDTHRQKILRIVLATRTRNGLSYVSQSFEEKFHGQNTDKRFYEVKNKIK